jgi:hypothetical protein
MAMTVVDLWLRPDVRERARAAFEGGGSTGGGVGEP